MVNGVVDIPLSGRPLGRRSSAPPGWNESATLGTFVAGPENRLVDVAVRSVLDEPGDGYSPIVFFGPSGTGKSHLAFGLATAWKARFRRRPVVYTTATDFARELADAIQTKTAHDFSLDYRRASLLVVEDVDHLAGKRAAQRELRSILDALTDGARVVVTATVAPGQLQGISLGLRSRLAAGLAVPLARPGHDARLAILGRLADVQGLELGGAAAELLAKRLNVAVPELLSVLTQLQFSLPTRGSVIDLETAQRFLARQNRASPPSVHQIALATARHFSLKLADLRSTSRRRAVVTARAVAMYLTRSLTGESLDRIGLYFGGRDHTTVSYGCRKTEERLEAEPEIRHAVLALKERLERS